MAEKLKKGLGTGLSALFGEDLLDEENSELLSVPILRVEPRSEQPRKTFDEAALNELADSIAQFGLIQPIVVRKLDNGYYQIIAGERRWRASRLAGLTEVPVRVIEADDRRTAELALVENLQREDLNPIEEAKGLQTLIEQYGLTQDEAAKSVGRSRPAVANSLRLLSLPESVLRLVEELRLSAGHARALLPITDEPVQFELAQKIIAEGLSVRKTEQLVSKTLKKLSEPDPDDTDAPAIDYAAETADYLSRVLARKVQLDIGKRSSGGRITLEFYDADDREALIENLARMGKSWQDNK